MAKRGDQSQVVYVDGDVPQLPLQLGQLLVDSSQIGLGTTNLQQCTSQAPLTYIPVVGAIPGDVTLYGATGDGVTDDWAAIQAAADANPKGTVYFPPGTYSISQSISAYKQNFIGSAMEDVRIVPTGNFECFVNSGIEFIIGSIQRMTIIYNNGVQPVSSVGNDRKIAVYWTAVSGRSPNFYNIEDVVVRGAWWAYYDDSGSYTCTFTRFFLQDCQNGFFKVNGTTFSLRNVICLNVNRAFHFVRHLGLSLASCASDGSVITAGGANCVFDECRGMTINGWDSESNSVTGADASLFYFRQSDVTLGGFTGYLNTVASAGGETVALFDFDDSVGTFSGTQPLYTAGSLVYTGSGDVATIRARNGSQVQVSGTTVSAATGGTPTNRYTMVADSTSRITYSRTRSSGGTTGLNVYEILSQRNGTATFAAATTVAVSLTPAEVDASYRVLLTPQADPVGRLWVSGKGTGGFTINNSSSTSISVDWLLTR